MRKKLKALAMSILVASSLIGCGEKEEAPMPISEMKTTLTVWAWDSNFNIPALKAAEQDYQQVNPDFKLEIIDMGNSDAIEDEIVAADEKKVYKSLPDLVLFQDHNIQKYVKNYPSAFVPVESAIIDWDNLGQDKVSYSIVDDVHYGVPVDAGTSVFAYRTDILAECGYTMDDVTGITWDRFAEIGQDVYEKTGKYLIGAIGKDNDLIYMMLQAEGESPFRGGSPYIVGNHTLCDVVSMIVKLQQNHVLYLAEDWTDYIDNAIGNDMLAGVYDGNWIISSMEQVSDHSGDWEITTAPSFSGEPGYSSNGGSSLCVTTNCKNSLVANDFLAYTFGGNSAIDGHSITYDEALTEAGLIGTCVAAAESEVYSQGVDYFNGQPIYSIIVEYSQEVPLVEQSEYHYECREIMSQAVLSIIEGNNIDDVLADAQVKLEEVISPTE